ncbi:Flp family type IVb pilin [Stenotrophomonas sp. ZAC14D2_NAIMI4_7]|uniref:Flp family type IVb pilin n=1 Tax=Stenotrophomonas TaxID=40323 RepID=UPI000D54246E|nr:MULTISPECIES: Flp family type IVb pilin [Stenotrophomonas]AWH17836.1 Flp family type IVb pilin [Stenotrophomonas sp. ZAC14D2_NAIMI4_7]AWH21719.1 Flp family type IVb pilin [Stenotrophomonas sp. ZAC14D2_NAIMI4_6]AWH25583.1 Flp family type IVb pilin [Stenotrophomonas sp. YAU14D1_LEIMI4_1]AWH29433.1 Flp family type IVb pilin [Stenotrophomonas sp. YAU14A_MKIMI4_1]AWH33424.1 Flp family type IVb pilin [Stenotrophomonas sp. SAU14A_NAIMI4_8]
MNASIKKFLKEEDGVTALEYGLLAAVIAGILVAVGNDQIRDFFETLFTTLKNVVTNAAGSASGGTGS